MITPKKLYAGFKLLFSGTSTARDAVPSALWTPAAGELWYDTATGLWYSYNGTGWVLLTGQAGASSAATGDITPDIDTYSQYCRTGLTGNIDINAPTGTPVDGQKLIIRVEDDNVSARTLTWNAIYEACGFALPSTTVQGKKTYIGLIYNAADTKWDCVAVSQEA